MRSVGALLLALGVARAHYGSEGMPGPVQGVNGMPELERREAYAANGHQWPPPQKFMGWPPVANGTESESYQRSRDAIEAWVRNLPDPAQRWNEWVTLVQSRLMPSFTDVGFKLTRAPEHLFQALNKTYYDGLHTTQHREKFRGQRRGGSVRLSEGNAPLFVYNQQLMDRVMRECRPRMEAWAGVPLKEGQAYGIRIYQNGSTLVNHVDRSETHVISFILHIASELDEPWPIQIEDHDGRVHSVNLTPGDMLYYESSKQYHARFTPMNGKHYGSVFVHYYPSEGWNWKNTDLITAVPLDYYDTVDEVRDPARRAALEEAGPRGAMERFYDGFWESRGYSAADVPPFPVGLDSPVQNICDLPGFCGGSPSLVSEEL
mmetsp:Transcript_29068/g.93007  ORF Transcript_29068/g.93007 Transcript_29068/m.93007 type:complete len:375 (-) Transcript_29068:239-1363(-)|eukprot:CAMPEP_0118856548 /NCGR_PEP_ID=MMETSP1163-20130328/3984_1 /TAXON_ID=124430 /ORGANISM="Phaeomonas parva, Strain CCMP2877" /LENGTH=374 /DNA_ID=CAMNT_0006789677 /DNA_START=182 /DNA_END=1306 /DNA_ORIENTATION=+